MADVGSGLGGGTGGLAGDEKTLAIVFSTILRSLSLVTIIGEDLCETS